MGYVVHHLMSTFWACVHEGIFARGAPRTLARELAEGAATAAAACFVDYRLTPRRFRPGFEKQLCRSSLAAVYASFGLGLVLTRLIGRRSRHL